MSIYISPETPRWAPTSEQDIQAAIDGGLLEENHWLELKREIEPGRSANRELARDLSSLAVDGGTYLVGIEEADTGLTLSPQVLSGLPERVEQVARSVPDPPLAVVCRSVQSESDPTVGYVVVNVPPSGQAPHMVDHRYLGRGDKTKIYLSDAEVIRLHERRRSSEADVMKLLDIEVARDPILTEHRKLAHLFLIAEPIPGRSGMALDLVSGSGWQQRLVSLRDEGMDPSVIAGLPLTGFSPDIDSAYGQQRRPHGAALAPHGIREIRSADQDSTREGQMIELEVTEDGQLRLFCGRLSDRLGEADAGRYVLFDQGVVLLFRRFLAIVTATADRTGYLGNWGLGVAITGLQGLKSYEYSRSFSSEGPAYSDDVYKRSAVASYAELTQMPGRITNALLGRFLRAVGTDQRLADALNDPHVEPPE